MRVMCKNRAHSTDPILRRRMADQTPATYERTVFYVSDGTGITAETLGHSIMTQFAGLRIRKETIPFIDSPDKAREAVARVNEAGRRDGKRPIVFSTLVEPAEKALWTEVKTRGPVIERAARDGAGFREAFAEASRFKPAVDQFFDDVLVMAPDEKVRQARLLLLYRLVTLFLQLGDISEIVAEPQ